MHPHEANRAKWDAATGRWKEQEDARGAWRRAHVEPDLVLLPAERPFLADVAGKEACVLGSGDQEVVFALVGLGARVTSVDISERRLEVAAERAAELGLEVEFLRADVTDLSAIPDGRFDLVYTGGHVAIWVSDIGRCYAEAARILRPGGRFVVNEYHPFRRIWPEEGGHLPHYAYLRRGPYECEDDGLPQFEYHWTVADHVQAVVDGGCRLVHVEEHEDRIDDEDWMEVDLNGLLPAYLLIVGERENR